MERFGINERTGTKITFRSSRNCYVDRNFAAFAFQMFADENCTREYSVPVRRYRTRIIERGLAANDYRDSGSSRFQSSPIINTLRNTDRCFVEQIFATVTTGRVTKSWNEIVTVSRDLIEAICRQPLIDRIHVHVQPMDVAFDLLDSVPLGVLGHPEIRVL